MYKPSVNKVYLFIYLFKKVYMGYSDPSNVPFLNQDLMNNYILRSYRDVIVVTTIATRKFSKAQSIVMY